MNSRLVSLMIYLLLFGVVSSATVFAEVSLGVSEGDWMEYNVTYTPPDDKPTWARIEVQSVQAKNITIELTVEYSDGTQENATTTIDLEAGTLGDGFIIPANLTSGDTFYAQSEGNITISGVEERTYAGARRTLVYAIVSQDTFYWDKPTGVLVEVSQSLTDYTMKIKADKNKHVANSTLRTRTNCLLRFNHCNDSDSSNCGILGHTKKEIPSTFCITIYLVVVYRTSKSRTIFHMMI